MGKISAEILKEAGDYVTKILEEKLPADILFHDLAHTQYVVEGVEEIGRKSGLNEDDLNRAKLCAWFHDVGFAVDPQNHEEEGIKIMTEFLSSKGVEENILIHVKNCILATQMPQQPKDLVSKVMCDADLRHLTENDYFERIELLRKEWINLTGENFGKTKFYKYSVKFFKNHNYHTEYAQKEYQSKKDKNFQQLKKEIYIMEQKKEKGLLGKKDKKKEKKGYSRGVESMFRLTARNQISLSAIADNKSNILISVNALIMSILLTVLVSRFEEVPSIIIPTIIFILFSLITIVFAILSTRPNISSGTFTKEDIRQNKVNLLFFGNFYNMELDDYEWAIEELMKNDENLYSTMIKDQYFLGKVLARKYKLLRIAYSIFMFGIIISVLSFVLAFVNI